MDRAELMNTIKEIVSEETEIPVSEIRDELTLEDLELDSLSISSILSNLYDIGIDVDVDKVFDKDEQYTIGELIEKIIDSVIG